MSMNKTISIRRKINDKDYFKLIYEKGKIHQLDYYSNEIKYSNYFILKLTNKQKEVSVEEFKEFNYAGYLFLNKDKYKVEQIMEWVDYTATYKLTYGIQYLTKPTPPFNPNKIIIKQ